LIAVLFGLWAGRAEPLLARSSVSAEMRITR
jgi:hypothetical protein